MESEVDIGMAGDKGMQQSCLRYLLHLSMCYMHVYYRGVDCEHSTGQRDQYSKVPCPDFSWF